MLVADLLKNHPTYDAKCNKRIAAYYDGGSQFPVKDELRYKPLELSAEQAAQPMRTARVGTAFYTNYFGDCILDLVSQVCKYPIVIEDKTNRPYWTSLNDNADGRLNTATASVRASVADDMLHNRAFYLVTFPEIQASVLSDQKKAGGLDARIVSIPAQSVTDWQEGDNGKLAWARTYEIETKRLSAFGPADTEVHRWTYYTTQSIEVYEATKEIGKTFDDKAEAYIAMSTAHSFGECPVFMLNRRLKMWLGDKLLPTAHQLFNEESDASYYQFVTITGGLFIFTDNKAAYKNGIELSPFGAVLCGPMDKIDRDRVDASALQALDAATSSRRGQIGGLIHTLARQAATQTASGMNTSRLSAKSQQTQSSPLLQFLIAFAEPQIAIWRRMCEAIANFREEEFSDIEVCGLISVDDDEDGDDPITVDNMAAESAFQAMPNVPDIAKRQRAKSLAMEANEDAPAEVKNAIANESVTKPAEKNVADATNNS